MREAKIEGGIIVDIAVSNDSMAGRVTIPDDVGIGWTENRDTNGVLVGYDKPAIALSAPTTILCIEATSRMLEEKAVTMGYDSITTAATYADEPAVLSYQTEGKALREWRSKVWEACFVIIVDIDADTRSQPTVADFLTELPVYV